ncbi:RHS repeat-associated core domain-containing protein [Actinoplanes sp. NPDC024001]|uniref:RHS repeat-associated core domain-containing protein n=1 Tax=Actinoplanes sp. NPDC024001 TaxID=3154598 RepID=UPI0033FB364B
MSARRLAAFCATLMVVTLAPLATSPAQAEPGAIPQVTAGAAPQQRGLPPNAASSAAVAENARPPVVPPGVRAGAEPEKISDQRLRSAQRLAPGEAFKDLMLRPGFVVGDTSLVVYFNLADEGFESWRVDLFDVDSGTRQESVTLGRDALETSRCEQPRKYCKSLGTAEGWQLDPARKYFATITGLYPDGEVTSAASDEATPRTTVNPPAVPDRQAAGCGCSTALGMTGASQAIRANGVNTGTGAYTRAEQDLTLNSFAVGFTSTRAYSSINTGPSAFGPGWAWAYDMKVSPGEGGVVVRAEDGSDTLFAQDGEGYVRPPGVRSTLRRAGDGWELVTRNNIVYAFDAQGRLTSILNPRRQGLRFGYGTDTITVTDASGHKAVVKLAEGLIRSIHLEDGRYVQYSYTDGLLTKVRDARGEPWQYRYDAAARLTVVVDPYRVTTVTNEYAANGRVARQLDALGAATTFEWNAAKQEARTVDADNVVVWDGYQGNVLLHTQRGNGETSVHRYDGKLNRDLVVNGNANQHETRYDAAGNPIEQFAPQRRFSEKTSYDARNNPTSHVDANGEKWTDEYNEFDELVKSTDPEGHSITYAYDERGRPVSVTDQRGKVTRYETVPVGERNSGLIEAVVSPEGRRSATLYDKTGRSIVTIDPRKNSTKFTYDDQNRVVAVLSPERLTPAVSVYDPTGRLVRSTTPAGVSTSYSYYPTGQLKTSATERVTTRLTYTPAGRRLTSAVDMKDQPDLVTSWTYNVKGLTATVTSPRGNLPGANKADFTTTYVYDANDNPIQIRRPYPGGRVVVKDIAVDDLDRTTSTTDGLGKSSSFERANTGEVRSTTDALGRKTSMTYDRNGRQTGITDSGGGQTKTEYDPAGNKIKQISATGGVTTYEYDDDNLLIAVTEPRGNVAGADRERFTTHFEYDAAGNQTKVIDALDNETTYRYDDANRLIATTDANRHTTVTTYTADDKTRSVIGPDSKLGAGTVYEYGVDGQVTAVSDPRGNRTRIDYDEAGRVVRSTDPLGRTTNLTYDAESNVVGMLSLDRLEVPWLISDKEKAARTVVDEYDIVGRRVQRTLGTNGPVYRWGYDAKDRTTSYGDPLGVREVAYDDEDQITTVTRKEAGRPDETFTYGYDARGNVTSRQYPDGTTVSFGYDADSQVTEQTAGAATWKFGYDVAGRRISTTLPGATGLVENRSYDNAGRLTAIGTERTGDPVPGVQDPVSRYDLTLDPVGNPTRVITTRGGVAESVAYAYDEADRVTSACYAVASCTDRDAKPAGRIDYGYDLVGNRTFQKRTGTAGNDLTTYLYDDADQLILEKLVGAAHLRTTAYTYDERGNQTRAGGDRFTYNLDNSVASSVAGDVTTNYRYGADGLRLSATQTGPDAAAATQRWSWDMAGTLPQIAIDTVEENGAVVEKRGFTYGPDDEPLALLDQANNAHSYTHDWLGGIANMLSPAGTLEAGYDYDPFGSPRVGESLAGQTIPEGAKPENPLQFHGAYQDSSTGEGNYFMRARNYDPGSGRFATRDPMPVGQEATSSYVYGANNPLAFTDPTGLAPEPGDTGAGTTPPEGTTVQTGPSPEEIARANQIQSKSTLDVILEAGGQILMEFLGINDILNCLKGDLGACASMIIGALPWGKIFKAKKIAEAIFRAGKAVITFFQELKWARAIIAGAEKAAEAAKAAAAAAAKAAAEKAAKAKAAAEAAAKKAAAEAAAKAKAQAAKLKAKTRKGAGEAKDGPSCRRRHSFSGETRVLMADGSSETIAELKPGDTVMATEPTTGEEGPRQVARTIRTDDDKEFVDVTVGRGEELTTTATHPFWSVTRQDWVDAGDLRVGESLRTADGRQVRVSALRSYTGEQRTYDLTVAGLHTYYVIAGDDPVLVHNVDEDEFCLQSLGPGPFAREGVHTSRRRVTRAHPEFHINNEHGARNGCHTCGATDPGTTSGNWIFDHQPPISTVDGPYSGTGYPHCLDCQRKQGGMMSQLSQENYDFPAETPRIGGLIDARHLNLITLN